MATVSIRDFRKSYGPVEVLHGVNLEISDGEFIVLVGESGCGKSTLLRMIAGLEEITSGDLLVDGQRMNDVETRERHTAMVFQSYALYPHMDVSKNIGFPLRVRKTGADVMSSMVAKTASMMGLSELLNRKPKQLSGGQRQRVAMGRAVVRSPKLFLFDEPLSNLDAKLRVEMRMQIRDLHRKIGATSIYVTHDQIEAMTLANRIVLLDKGVVQQVGAPMELYSTPVNTFVASFIGSPQMNLIDGSLDIQEGKRVFHNTDGLKVDIPDDLDFGFMVGMPTVLGIRPEHISIQGGTLSLECLDKEHLGSDTILFAQIGKTSICARLIGFHEIGSGKLNCQFMTEHLHFYEKKTGIRL